MNTASIATIRMVVNEMDDDEVRAHLLSALLGTTHEGRLGYDKLKPLLTQNNGTTMHDDVRAIFLTLCNERLRG